MFCFVSPFVYNIIIWNPSSLLRCFISWCTPGTTVSRFLSLQSLAAPATGISQPP